MYDPFEYSYWELFPIYVPYFGQKFEKNLIFVPNFRCKKSHISHIFFLLPGGHPVLNNSSKTPENQTYTTNTKLSVIKYVNRDIINITRSLNVDKAHGNDNISIRILRMCDTAIVEQLSTIFNNCVIRSMFPDIWK